MLHDEGYYVTLCGRRTREGLASAERLDPSRETAIFVRCDVANFQGQTTLYHEVWKKWQRLDVVVANAGVVDQDSKYDLGVDRTNLLLRESLEEPDTTCINVDLKGSIFSIYLATKYMQQNPGAKGGKIIVTGSALGVYPNPTFPEYCAAKAGLHQYVKAVAPILLVHHDITIHGVMPGQIQTGAMPNFAAAFPPEHMTRKDPLMQHFREYIEDTSQKTGRVAEVGHDASLERDSPLCIVGSSQKCWTNPYDE